MAQWFKCSLSQSISMSIIYSAYMMRCLRVLINTCVRRVKKINSLCGEDGCFKSMDEDTKNMIKDIQDNVYVIFYNCMLTIAFEVIRLFGHKKIPINSKLRSPPVFIGPHVITRNALLQFYEVIKDNAPVKKCASV
ncbi:hypothetical protein HELRODRAFT_174168 [Helobdella robusta]|uniref:Uncharacterized protein n=1 Tax=Helobdella robusta TaxID=6412 RepID=T1F7Q4_HELRO|nr:hypothetical protein HELRODRAFT_174168 [Helobdella robusta]ESO02762.1 hypothetical protein HELRODRAFT_174168 [Helobdella robusta]